MGHQAGGQGRTLKLDIKHGQDSILAGPIAELMLRDQVGHLTDSNTNLLFQF